jgi:hypothetical protein
MANIFKIFHDEYFKFILFNKSLIPQLFDDETVDIKKVLKLVNERDIVSVDGAAE